MIANVRLWWGFVLCVVVGTVGCAHEIRPQVVAPDPVFLSSMHALELDDQAQAEMEKIRRIHELAASVPEPSRSNGEMELESGKCFRDRIDKFHRLENVMDQTFDQLNDRDSLFIVEGTHPVMARPEGEPVTMRSSLGGDEHVFVIGFDQQRLELKDRNGQLVQNRSPYESVLQVAGGLSGIEFYSADSREIRMNPGESLTLKVRGQGCALVVLVRRH